jgi:Domain of unknown function (DUF2017)
MARPRPPVYRVKGRYRLHIGDDELGLIRRLLDELRELLLSDEDGSGATSPMLTRLFPVAHPDDAELEAEYQRLMRVELVASKLKAIEAVETVIDAHDELIDEAQLTAFMQSINSIRLVLGTLLDVTDDPDAEVVSEHDDTAEYQLYGYLSWLLEWTVRAFAND